MKPPIKDGEMSIKVDAKHEQDMRTIMHKDQDAADEQQTSEQILHDVGANPGTWVHTASYPL